MQVKPHKNSAELQAWLVIYRRLSNDHIPPNCLSAAEQNVGSRTCYGTIDSEVQKDNYSGSSLKGPVKAVSGHKIAPNRVKATYRSVLTLEEKKQSDRNSLLLTCLKLFQASTRL